MTNYKVSVLMFNILLNHNPYLSRQSVGSSGM